MDPNICSEQPFGDFEGTYNWINNNFLFIVDLYKFLGKICEYRYTSCKSENVEEEKEFLTDYCKFLLADLPCETLVASFVELWPFILSSIFLLLR